MHSVGEKHNCGHIEQRSKPRCVPNISSYLFLPVCCDNQNHEWCFYYPQLSGFQIQVSLEYCTRCGWCCSDSQIPQSRFEDKLHIIWLVCPHNGTAVLKGLTTCYTISRWEPFDRVIVLFLGLRESSSFWLCDVHRRRIACYSATTIFGLNFEWDTGPLVT